MKNLKIIIEMNGANINLAGKNAYITYNIEKGTLTFSLNFIRVF